LEFGGSGEDSFVAVVVTKLTGALLFILLLTMVIMALLPKAIDLPSSPSGEEKSDALPLAISTPGTLPEAIAGRPYVVALAATGGSGPIRWAVDGPLPAGLTFDPESAQLRGTPRAGTAKPASLVIRASDGKDRAAQATSLVVYESDRPLTIPSKWAPHLPPIPWRAWLEQGVGFLILWLIYLVGMNTLAALQRRVQALAQADEPVERTRQRFAAYRWTVRLGALGSAAALALWLVQQRGA
jgi:hypothetical protein